MAFQGIFRRHNKFVVVKPVRLTAKDTLEVGTVIDLERDNVKWFQLRLWFRRRRIGTEGSDWANQILDGSRRPEGAAINKKYDIQKLADTLVAVANGKAEDHPPLIGLETEEGAKELSDVKVDEPADTTIEPAKVQETASTEPEVDIDELAAAADKEQKEADDAKAVLARAKKDAKNKRERERRAAAKAAK